MACKLYSLYNKGTIEIYFDYQKCDDNIWEYQVELKPNENKNIWLTNGTFNLSPSYFQDLEIVEITNFPPLPVTPTLTPTPTTTPAESPEPTPTITPTFTSTPTVTPTVTPSTTPPPVLLPNDVLFVDNITNSIYGYTPITNTVKFLFQVENSNTILNIANTETRVFINYSNGDIDEYFMTLNPFSLTYSTTYSFPEDIGVSLFAIDNNFLLTGSNTINKLNLSASTSTTLFSLSGSCENCISSGGLLYYPTLDQYLINYYDTTTGNNFVSIFDSTGSTISTINLSIFLPPLYPDTTEILGLYTSDDIIYGISFNMNIYEINFSDLTLLGPVQPINVTGETSVGTSMSIDFVSWTVPAPIFEY